MTVTRATIFGKEVGDLVTAQCEHDGCTATIRRGLRAACGHSHVRGDDKCNGYFCEEHIKMTKVGRRCLTCAVIVKANSE